MTKRLPTLKVVHVLLVAMMTASVVTLVPGLLEADASPIVTTGDLSVTATHTSPATAGGAFSATASITNAGADPTGPMTVTATLPTGVSYTSFSSPGLFSCSTSGQDVICTLGNGLAVPRSTTLTLDLSGTPEAFAGIAWVVAGAGDDESPADNAAIHRLDFGETADVIAGLVLSGTWVSGSGPGAGDPVVEASVTNGSTTVDAGGDLTIDISLPDGVSVADGFTPPAGWTCDVIWTQVRCSNPDRLAPAGGAAPAGSETVAIPVQISGGAAGGTAPSDQALVSIMVDSGTDDPVSFNNAASAVLPNPGTSDLSMTKSSFGTTIGQGAAVRYSLRIGNAGPDPTSGPVTVTDTLPAGLTFIGAIGQAFQCDAVGQVITCTRAVPLSVGPFAATLSVFARANADAVGSLENTATVSVGAPSTDPNTANDTGTATGTVDPNIDLRARLLTGIDGDFRCGYLFYEGDPSSFRYNGYYFPPNPDDPAALPNQFGFDKFLFDHYRLGQPLVTTVRDCSDPFLENPWQGPPIDTSGLVPGDPLAYRMTTFNTGPSTAAGTITANLSLPAGLTPDSIVEEAGWTCTASGSTVTCTSDDPILPTQAALPVLTEIATVTVITPSTASPGTSFDATLTVSGNPVQNDTDGTNNTDNSSNVAAIPDIDVQVTAVPYGRDRDGSLLEFGAGMPIVFDILLGNNSSVPAPIPEITFPVPTGYVIDQLVPGGVINGPPGIYDSAESAGVVTCTPRAEFADVRLVHDASVEIFVRGHVECPVNDPTLGLQVTAATVPGEADASNNQDSESIAIRDDLRHFVKHMSLPYIPTIRPGNTPAVPGPYPVDGSERVNVEFSFKNWGCDVENLVLEDLSPQGGLSGLAADEAVFVQFEGPARWVPATADNAVARDTVNGTHKPWSGFPTDGSVGYYLAKAWGTSFTGNGLLPAAEIPWFHSVFGDGGPNWHIPMGSGVLQDQLSGHNSQSGTLMVGLDPDGPPLNVMRWSRDDYVDRVDPTTGGWERADFLPVQTDPTTIVYEAGTRGIESWTLDLGHVESGETIRIGTVAVLAADPGWDTTNPSLDPRPGPDPYCVVNQSFNLGDDGNGNEVTFLGNNNFAASHPSSGGYDARFANGACGSPAPPPGPTTPEQHDAAIYKRVTSSMYPPEATNADAGYYSGALVEFELAVANEGLEDEVGTVGIVDAVPVTMTNVTVEPTTSNGSGTCSVAGNTVTCTGISLDVDEIATVLVTAEAPFQSTPVEITNSAQVTLGTDDDPSNNQDSASIEVVARTDLSVQKTLVAAGRPGSGTTVFDIVVANSSPSTDPGPITVVDTLPDLFGFDGSSTTILVTDDTGTIDLTSANPTGWLCSVTVATPRSSVVCTRSPAEGDATYPTIRISGLEPANQPIPRTNDVTVTGTLVDIDPTNDDDKVDYDPSVYDLRVEKFTSGSDEFRPGETILWFVQVTNDSPGGADLVPMFVDTLPPGAAFLRTIFNPANGRPSCSQSGDQVTCTWSAARALAPGSSYLVVLEVQLPDTVGVHLNQVDVAINDALQDPIVFDEDPTNNHAEHAVETVIRPDLVIDKSHVGAAAVGSELVFTIDVSNQGDADDPGPIVVTDVLPAGTSFVSGIDADGGADWQCAAAGQVVTCTRAGGLAVDEADAISLTVRADDFPTPTLRNSASVRGSICEFSDTLADNLTDDLISVTPEADLEIVKSHVGTPAPGEGIDFDVVVENLGADDTPGSLVVREELPEGLTLRSPEATVPAGWSIIVVGQTLFFTSPDGLAASEQVSFTVHATLDADLVSTVLNVVAVDGPLPDPDPSNDVDDDPVSPPSRIGNQVWLDVDDDGLFEPDDATDPESGIAGVVVELWLDDGDGAFDPAVDTPVSETVTDAAGNWWFDDLGPGAYFPVIPDPATWDATGADSTALDGARSSTDPATSSDGTTDHDDDGAPAAGYAATSALVVIGAGTAQPSGETFPGGTAGDEEAAANTANATSTADESSNLTVDFGFTIDHALGNLVWVDLDDDGAYEPLAGESPIPGVTVNLLDGSGAAVLDASSNPVRAVTGADGLFVFDGLRPGDYVAEIDASNFAAAGPLEGLRSSTTTSTLDDEIDNDDNGMPVDASGVAVADTAVFAAVRSTAIALGEADGEPTGEDPASTTTATDAAGDVSVDFGFYAPVSIGDLVWFDADGDGAQAGDAGEPGVADVTVTLATSTGAAVTDVFGSAVGADTTDANGSYGFGDLPPGEYVVTFTLPDGTRWTTTGPTSATDGSSDPADSDAGYAAATDATASSEPTTLASGENDPNWDAGVIVDAAIRLETQVADPDDPTVWFNADSLDGETGADALAVLHRVGERALYRYLITNTGTADLTDVRLSDTTAGLVGTCPGADSVIVAAPSALEAGQSTTVAAVCESPELSGQFVNNATVVGSPAFEDPADPGQWLRFDTEWGLPAGSLDVTDTDPAEVQTVAPLVQLDKEIEFDTIDTATASVTFTIDVWHTSTNVAHLELGGAGHGDDVIDPLCDTLTFSGGDTDTNDLLGLAEIWTYDCVVDQPASGWPAGFTNTATVGAEVPATDPGDPRPLPVIDPNGPDTSASDSVEVQLGEVSVAMWVRELHNDVTDPTSAPGPWMPAETVRAGELVEWLVQVTNPGGAPVAEVTLTDPRCSTLVPFSGAHPDGISSIAAAVDADNTSDTNRFGSLDPYAVLSVGETWWYMCSDPVAIPDTTGTGTPSVVNTVTLTAAPLEPTDPADPTSPLVTVTDPALAGTASAQADGVEPHVSVHLQVLDSLLGWIDADAVVGTEGTNSGDIATFAAGDDVTYRVIVHNADSTDPSDTTPDHDGITLADLVVTLTLPDGSTETLTLGSLAPGAAHTFTDVIDADVTTGGTATAVVSSAGSTLAGEAMGPVDGTDGDLDVDDTDSAVIQVASLSLKTYVEDTDAALTPTGTFVDAQDGDTPPAYYQQDTVNYQIHVHNDGDVALWQPTPPDDGLADCSALTRILDFPGDNDGVLDVGETWIYTCTLPGTATDALSALRNIADTVAYPIALDPAGEPILTDPTDPTSAPARLHADLTDADEANITLLPLAAIGDHVWEDLDGDGIQDPGEPPVTDVLVGLRDGTGAVVETTRTNTAGDYRFSELRPGDYSVSFTAPAGWTITTRDAGTDDLVDSDPDPATGDTIVTRLDPGEADMSWDAGLWRPAAIGDHVFEDLNGNGIQDSGEPAVDGVTIELRDPTGTVITTATTGIDGTYHFEGLAPGTYQIGIVAPTGWIVTTADAGTDDTIDYDIDPTTARAPATLLESDETDPTWDIGLYRPAQIGNYAWNDTDQDGTQDSGETPAAGITVRLLDTAGTIVATTTTDATGYYLFDQLPPGTYTVAFLLTTLPCDCVATQQHAGDDTTVDSNANQATGQSSPVTLASGDSDLTIALGIYQDPNVGSGSAGRTTGTISTTPLAFTGNNTVDLVLTAAALLALGAFLLIAVRGGRGLKGHAPRGGVTEGRG